MWLSVKYIANQLIASYILIAIYTFLIDNHMHTHLSATIEEWLYTSNSKVIRRGEHSNVYNYLLII